MNNNDNENGRMSISDNVINVNGVGGRNNNNGDNTSEEERAKRRRRREAWEASSMSGAGNKLLVGKNEKASLKKKVNELILIIMAYS